MEGRKVYLKESQALELIELRQSLGLEKPLSSEELNKLKEEMCKIPLGTLY